MIDWIPLFPPPSGECVFLQSPLITCSVPPLENNGFSTYEMYMPYLGVLPHHKDFNVEKVQDDHYAKSSFSLYDAYFPHESAFAGKISSTFKVSISPQRHDNQSTTQM